MAGSAAAAIVIAAERAAVTEGDVNVEPAFPKEANAAEKNLEAKELAGEGGREVTMFVKVGSAAEAEVVGDGEHVGIAAVAAVAAGRRAFRKRCGDS